MFDFFKVQKVVVKKQSIPEATDIANIHAIALYFQKHTGIEFDSSSSVFQIKMKSFCKMHKVSSFKNILIELQKNQDLKQELINYLTTNESYFNREFHQIESLVASVKESFSHVRILCVPCSHGEEPYSIAIALLEAGVSSTKFDITGIDINKEVIAQAQQAIYNEKAIRNLSASVRSSYFTKEGSLFSLHSEIKNKVTFKCINIFESSFQKLEKFDYIFSRNMLIYFDTSTRIKAQKLFEEHLVDTSKDIYYGHADVTHLHTLS
ncbi:protein-glutamate O-methyltransferase CheR [Sulfurimonas sp. SAG-AH-194-I05]|nr:CheR family methyltransferase [Sulfurimonas sp. SAG-AH-194-I05]MDF1874894.1 protein-glutamate O-methyltransferase CheR [Sulfurimonas sp. SAG-AH-194-I05]